MKKITSTRVCLTASLLLATVAAVWLLNPHNFVRSTHAEKNYCIANLKQIDGAIQQWALENKKEDTDAPDLAGAVRYLKGSVLPVCPRGGSYRAGATVKDAPTCNLGPTLGHSLP